MEEIPQKAAPRDPYTDQFLTSPTYIMHFRNTIDTAAASYKLARILSVILFVVGIGLLGVAVFFSFTRNEETLRWILSLIFGGLGTVNLIALLLYRPIERIQSGVNELIKSQIVGLSFLAQHDSIRHTLATMSKLPLEQADLDKQLKLAQYLRESASQAVADLNLQAPVTSVTQPDAKKAKSPPS